MKSLPRRPARTLLLSLLGIALLAAGALAWIGRGGTEPLPPRAPGERSPLMLVTSLPLLFPEEFTLEGAGSPALEALETRYRVEPIGITDTGSLRGGNLLLMAHALAQPAEALVDLDRWVRGGGRVLILADPKLDWPSELPLGDVRRPPPSFPDTGLLGHWGLQLEDPQDGGPQERVIDGRTIQLSSPGTLTGRCETAGEGLVARCAIGKGRATIIADADLLQPNDDSPKQVEANLAFLLAELERLER